MNIEAKLNTFFLHNMAYCAAVKHRNPSESVFIFKSARIELSSGKDTAAVLLIDEWVDKVISSSSEDAVHLLYYYFVDRDTLDYLREKVFNKIDFSKFERYFLLAQSELEKLSLSSGNFYRYVNFYHLIGSMRLLTNCDDDGISEKIIFHLIKIIRSELPLIIKFSSRQILVNHYHDKLSKSDIASIDRFNDLLRKEIANNSEITKFLALYYLYYYDFSYNIGQLVEELSRKLSKMEGVKLLANLSTNVPQLQSLMIRKGYSKKVCKKLNPLYRIKHDVATFSGSISDVFKEIASVGGVI